jgi:hypothetical protein
LQEKDAKMALMIEKKRERTEAMDHQQRNIQTTIPFYRKIIELIEDEVRGIKLTPSTRRNCFLFSNEI